MQAGNGGCLFVHMRQPLDLGGIQEITQHLHIPVVKGPHRNKDEGYGEDNAAPAPEDIGKHLLPNSREQVKTGTRKGLERLDLGYEMWIPNVAAQGRGLGHFVARWFT